MDGLLQTTHYSNKCQHQLMLTLYIFLEKLTMLSDIYPEKVPGLK